MQTYPNDPHIDYSWPGGKSALSPKGSLQMYTLGENLRRRYHRLLPSDDFYAAECMEVMSSPRERTLMSSQSFLAGFIPPPIERNLLPISWQPIAIHSLPAQLDNVSRKCLGLWIRVNFIAFFSFAADFAGEWVPKVRPNIRKLDEQPTARFARLLSSQCRMVCIFNRTYRNGEYWEVRSYCASPPTSINGILLLCLQLERDQC